MASPSLRNRALFESRGVYLSYSFRPAFKQAVYEPDQRMRAGHFRGQEFMGQMLGVGRATVNTAASVLQRAGFVRYVRGRITVADRAGLESAACECYQVIRHEFDRLLS